MMRIGPLLLVLAVLAGPAHADHWIDMPAWPKPLPAVAHLRWVLAPAQQADSAETKRPVTLEIEADGITRAVVLDPQPGELRRDEVSLGKGEVGELAFARVGFVVKRSGDALTVIARPLEAAAPHRDEQLAKLHLPARLPLTQEIVQVDAKGNRSPLPAR